MLQLTEEQALAPALDLLSKSGTVLLAPTETVYGLICAADDNAARERIYQLKHRPQNKMLANFVPSIDMVRQTVGFVPEVAEKIAECFCPGPVTLVIPDGNGSTYGFRIPDHPFMLALLRAYGKTLASTSANLSGEPAALSVPEALRSLDGEVDLAIDGGTIPADSLASTVIMVNADNSWKILRQGPVTEEMLAKVLNQMEKS